MQATPNFETSPPHQLPPSSSRELLSKFKHHGKQASHPNKTLDGYLLESSSPHTRLSYSKDSEFN